MNGLVVGILQNNMNYYITHSDKNYLPVVEKLFDSLEQHSNYKIIYFSVNFEYTPSNKNVICIPYYIDFNYSDFNIADRNILNNNENTRANLLFLKSKICRDALQLGDHNFCYVDADCIAVKNCDEIFDCIDRSIDYPLLGRNCHDYMIYNGKGNPFRSDGVFDLNLCLEADLLKILGIPIEKRTYLYRQTNLFLFTEKCKNILEEWSAICYKKEIIDNWQHFAGFNDETILNCLLWKNDLNKHLNQISINIPYIKDGLLVNDSYLNDFIKTFLNPPNESFHFDTFCLIPAKQNINNIKFLHGRVSDAQYKILKQNLNHLNEDILFFDYSKDLYFNFFVKHRYDSPLKLKCYGMEEDKEFLIFETSFNFEKDTFFYFDEYSPMALFDKIKIKYNHGNIENYIDIDNSKLYDSVFRKNNLTWDEKIYLINSSNILKEIFIKKCYRYPKIFESQNVIDIGSNVGYFIKFLTNKINIQKAVAVEADSRLKKHFEIINSDSLNKITYLNKAFDCCNDKNVELHLTDLDCCGCQSTNKDYLKSYNIKEIKTVQSIDLTELMKNFDIVDTIKSDCEGSEVHIFKEENKYNLINRVRKIVFENHELKNEENHPSNNNTVLKFLTDIDYECYWRYLGDGGQSNLYINYCLNKKFYSLNKILYLVPHLSTGGMPKYLLEKIKQDLKQNKDIYVIEYNFYGDKYVVQRNEIKEILKEKFFAVYGNFDSFLDILHKINPDILHIQDEPEIFPNISKQQFEKIYDKNREYFIHETCHNSEYDPVNKTLVPDKFVFCTKWIESKYKNIKISNELSDIDFEIKSKDRDFHFNKLNLNSNKKHVVQIGLFNDNKNQKYTFELARQLINEDIEFHFIGNLADNFKNDWQPLIDDKPSNCRIWGERSDVESFLNICDLFIMPSKKELNPISIKEALSYNNKCIISDIETLKYKYDKNENVYWLSNQINTDAKKIKEILNIKTKTIKFGLVTTFYNVEKYVDETVDSVLNQTYKNWIWFVTDDGSTDGTKEKILNHCKNTPNIIYVEQKFKKEMFWQPQHFVTKDCDYVVTVDSDDFLLPKALEVYKEILLNNKDIISLSCENISFKEEFDDGKLLNASFIDFSGVYSQKYKIRNYTEDELWTFTRSLHHWGHLRCFKNIEGLDFGVYEYNAGCNNDTLHFSMLQKYGTHLNVKRYLYKYRFRDKGISHRVLKDEEWIQHNNINNIIFNLDNSNYYPCSEKYNVDYNNYNTLLLSSFNNEKGPCNVSLLTNKINDPKSFKELYFDHNLILNEINPDSKYICINFDLGEENLQKIFDFIKDIDYKEVCVYSSISGNFSKNELESMTQKNLEKLTAIFYKNFGWYWSSLYYRHLYFKISK